MMSKYSFYAYSLLLIAFVSVGITSCRAIFETKIDAASAYASKQYITASELLIEKYNNTKELSVQSDLAYKIAECFRMANRTQKAEKWYKRAIDYNYDADMVFKYALMLKSNGKYNQAMAIFKEYALGNPNDRARATRQIQSCRKAIEWQEVNSDIKVVNLKSINSNASDFSPVFYTDNQMVITSSRKEATGDDLYGWTGEKHSDLFSVINKGEFNFTNPIQFGDSINTAFNEGTACFNATYDKVYFTACGGVGEKDDFCQIYTSYKNEEGRWTLPNRVILFENDTINVGQPYLTPDSKELYFVADAPEGFGDKDIYKVTLMNDGFWSTPKNLGPEINTDQYDGFPYVAADGFLYFASNGHAGMGGLDIFKASRSGSNWVAAENLKYPINSSADDFGYIMQPYIQPELMDSIESIGYFASSRVGGLGNDDIYAFYVEIPQEEEIDSLIVDIPDTNNIAPPKILYVLNGSVVQKQFAVASNPNSEIIGKMPVPQAIATVLGLSVESNIDQRIVCDNQGKFSLLLEENTDYKVTAYSNGYFRQAKNITTSGYNTEGKDTINIFVELEIDKIFKRQEITLENIYYDFDSDAIRDDAKPTLNELAKLLRENPSIVIRLGSHTDSRGADRYNLDLSQRRAQSAVDYLKSLGINAARLSALGYGETQLVNNCSNGIDCSEEEHQRNRRTTFEVVSDSYRGDGLGL